MIRTYYLLTKPGIIMGNLITTVSGFALASKGFFDWHLFIAVLVGLGAVIGSACVFNNYIDRDLDKKMTRTKNRALAKGTISGLHALIFALILGVFGMVVLGIYTNLLTCLITAIGFFVYVILYSFWKCHSTYATAVGSIAGAIPPVAGYCAVSNRFDMGALFLFMVLVLWQMPHFFSIAMYRIKEYTAASIPVMPVIKGSKATKQRMLIYISGFILTSCLMVGVAPLGWVYFLIALVLGSGWLVLCLRGFTTKNDPLWARNMFRFSLVVITALCFSMSINRL